MKTITRTSTLILLALASQALAAAGDNSSSSSGSSSNNGSSTQAIPSIPQGAFSANPTVVQTGTYPTLNWSITYPSRVGDVATITAPGQLNLTQQMYVSVRPVGVGVTATGRTGETSTIPVDLRMSVNGGSYTQLFYGTNSVVEPAYSLYIKRLQSGSTINFGGSYSSGSGSSAFYTSRSGNMQVISLVDGDTIPTTFDLRQSGKLADYIKPYVDGTGKVKVGPMNVLVLFELGDTSHGSGSFDYQDAAFIVNFATKHPNNGHGNNLDGVDSSNPGQGSGGPNGAVDLSAGVDDEAK